MQASDLLESSDTMLRRALLLPWLIAATTLPACAVDAASDADEAAAAVGTDPLWDDASVLAIELRAPLAELFARSANSMSRDELPAVRGTLRFGQRDLAVSVRQRGNTSALETECSFPKLRVTIDRDQDLSGTPFVGHRKLVLNSHCGERPTSERTDYGRVANEVSPMREHLAYRMVRALDLPTYRTRLSRIRYVDDATPDQALVRHGLFIEHKDEALARFKAEGLIPDSAKEVDVTTEEAEGDDDPDLMDRRLAARIHLAEALLGNQDFRLHLGSRTEPERWTDTGPLFAPPLWNIDVFGTTGNGGEQLPVIQDFDLSGVVAPVKPAPMLDPSRTFGADNATQIAMSGIQLVRTMISREDFDAAVAAVKARRAAVEAELARGAVDAEGRANAQKLVKSFFDLLESDMLYPPVVASEGVRVVDPASGADDERCLAPIPVGTPAMKLATAPRRVNGLALVEVRLLDVKSYLPCLYPEMEYAPARTAWVPDTIRISTGVPTAAGNAAVDGCNSSTLGRRVEEGACVQRSTDQKWFRCVGAEQWLGSSADDAQCTSKHPAR